MTEPEEWSPEKENIPERYMKKVMEWMEQLEKTWSKEIDRLRDRIAALEAAPGPVGVGEAYTPPPPPTRSEIAERIKETWALVKETLPDASEDIKYEAFRSLVQSGYPWKQRIG